MVLGKKGVTSSLKYTKELIAQQHFQLLLELHPLYGRWQFVQSLNKFLLFTGYLILTSLSHP
jgi:uncharacterized Zn finger protein